MKYFESRISTPEIYPFEDLTTPGYILSLVLNAENQTFTSFIISAEPAWIYELN